MIDLIQREIVIDEVGILGIVELKSAIAGLAVGSGPAWTDPLNS